MQLPSIYSDANDKIKQIIIELGTSCYNKLFKDMEYEDILLSYAKVNKDSIQDYYEKENRLLKKQVDDNFNNYKMELEKLTHKIHCEKENEIKMLNEKNIILQKEIDKIVNEKLMSQKLIHEKELQYHENNLNNVKDKYNLEKTFTENKLQDLSNELNKKQDVIDNFIGKRDFSNNTEQGDVGEKMIDNVVQLGLTCDSKAIVEDSSKGGGSGDRIITFSNNLKMMIEVKNKNIITKEDREQFIHHYTNDFKENKCNMALFVSLITEQIPNIGNKPILFYNDKVGYIGINKNLTLDERYLRIERAIQELYDYYKRDVEQEKDEVENKDFSVYNDLLSIRISNKAKWEKKVKKYSKKLENANKECTNSKKFLNELYRKIQNDNIIIEDKYVDEKMYIDELVITINKWVSEIKPLMKKHTYKKIIIDGMKLTDLDKKFINKKIKFTDISQQPDSNQ
jgi:hypothetical protein